MALQRAGDLGSAACGLVFRKQLLWRRFQQKGNFLQPQEGLFLEQTELKTVSLHLISRAGTGTNVSPVISDQEAL